MSPTRKPPRTRVHLPFADWPEIDRAAWTALFREGDVLDGRGAARHWAEATRATNLRHYARWLGWLDATGRLDPQTAPCDRLTPAALRAYWHAVRDTVSPRTLASAVIGLKCVVKRMEPGRDWRWLMDMSNRLDAAAAPSVDRRDRILPARRVFADALVELERLATSEKMSWRDRIAFRDTLMIALLTACPVRLRNLTAIRIGTHLLWRGEEWSLTFGPEETKTGRAQRHLVPEAMDPHLEFYLAEVRPGFRMAPGCDRMWPGGEGRPLAPETLYMRITLVTRRLFGIAINPHAFRSIAATALAESSGEDALHARPLLGHRRSGSTETHYIHASPIEAGRRVAGTLRAIRDGRIGSPRR